MPKLSITVNNFDKKRSALERLETMACALVENGVLSLSKRQILEFEAEKLAVSNADLEDIINKVLGEKSVVEPPPPPSTESKTASNVVTNEPADMTYNFPKTESEPVDGKKENKKIFPLIIAISAVLIGVLIWLIYQQDEPKPLVGHETGQQQTDNGNQDDNDEDGEPDTILIKLIQDGDDIFKTKNVARAKKFFENALQQCPGNAEISSRITKCDEIIKAANYTALKQERGTSPEGENNKLGYADMQGYIVVDFLYDEEISRGGEMLALKTNGKYGVVGGDLKETSEFKYIETLWIPQSKSYRLVIDQTGIADIVSIENGIIKIVKYQQ